MIDLARVLLSSTDMFLKIPFSGGVLLPYIWHSSMAVGGRLRPGTDNALGQIDGHKASSIAILLEVVLGQQPIP